MECPSSTDFGYAIIGGKRYNRDTVVMPNGKVIVRAKEMSKDLAPQYGHTLLGERCSNTV